ncbi:hypothetical protein Tsubulata_004019 [Turnera subulata]|uniref:DUF4283 domain-containing protein n=1 Tax=Turnera subulata TaxID=218843 RepID=A0A9Q0JMN1_9ROSI|nr:hypothetical protein Tsubulata_004019 [Turnera subulata]
MKSYHLHRFWTLRRQLDGKNVVVSVLLPVQSTDSSSSSPASAIANLGARVNTDKQINLGVPPVVLPPTLPKVSSSPHSWASVAKGPPLHPLQFDKPIYAADSNVIQISLSQDGLYLFQYPTDSSLSRALQGGPWRIGGIPLFLRKWDVNIKPIDFSASVIPVWVQLKHVPFELMTNEGLSYLASTIGKPIHMNQDCSKLFSSDRVTICIDVDYSKPLLDELAVALDGCTRTIKISYSWKPICCDMCHKWGHHHLACPTKQPSVQWIPKVAAADSMKLVE